MKPDLPPLWTYPRMVESCGPVTMIPQKTRVVFMVRMPFAGATVRRTNLRIGLILERKLPADQKHLERRGNAVRRVKAGIHR